MLKKTFDSLMWWVRSTTLSAGILYVGAMTWILANNSFGIWVTAMPDWTNGFETLGGMLIILGLSYAEITELKKLSKKKIYGTVSSKFA